MHIYQLKLDFLHLFFYSEEQSRLAARKYARVIQKLGFPVSCLALDGPQFFLEKKSIYFLSVNSFHYNQIIVFYVKLYEQEEQ